MTICLATLNIQRRPTLPGCSSGVGLRQVRNTVSCTTSYSLPRSPLVSPTTLEVQGHRRARRTARAAGQSDGGKWYDVTRHREVTGPTDLIGYAADLTQTPTFIRLGTPDTGTLMHALAAA